jgi:hypothetical protein
MAKEFQHKVIKKFVSSLREYFKLPPPEDDVLDRLEYIMRTRMSDIAEDWKCPPDKLQEHFLADLPSNIETLTKRTLNDQEKLHLNIEIAAFVHAVTGENAAKQYLASQSMSKEFSRQL